MKKKEEASINEELSFEDAMKDLESIVAELESNELTLDESIEKFKKGMDLSNYCNKLLNKAEKSITILLEQNDGSMLEEKFAVEE